MIWMSSFLLIISSPKVLVEVRESWHCISKSNEKRKIAYTKASSRDDPNPVFGLLNCISMYAYVKHECVGLDEFTKRPVIQGIIVHPHKCPRKNKALSRLRKYEILLWKHLIFFVREQWAPLQRVEWDGRHVTTFSNERFEFVTAEFYFMAWGLTTRSVEIT